MHAYRMVAVRFKKAGKLFYYDTRGEDYEVDEWVIVETLKGSEAGWVVLPPRMVEESQLTEPLRPITRRATEDDINRMYALRNRNKEAIERCTERIKTHALPMRLVDGEYNHDGSRLTFFFTADGRVDFRLLVRDLASIFRTRIELRQIGVRDKAKIVGGVGRCGETLCCSTWATEFPIVSIKTAKDQDLPLNPSRITGECGRLLCCLQYEQKQYIEMKKDMPKVGERIEHPLNGQGKVMGRNILKGTVNVALDSGAYKEFVNTEVSRLVKDHATLMAEGGPDPDDEVNLTDLIELEDEGDADFLRSS